MRAKKLQDDCFAHDPKRIKAADALDLLRARMAPVVGTERVPLAAAHGRILAEPLTSSRNVPAFTNVAVDGYAFAHASLEATGETALALLPGRAAAGHPFAGHVPPGHAVRVLTGGALPDGTDTALMQVDLRLEGERVIVPPGARRGANCREAGEDIREGQTVLTPGCRLRPQEVGVAATLGRAEVSVFRPLEVALVSSGDELREPGGALPHGMTYDSNRPILGGLLRGVGVEAADQGIWPDDAALVERRLAAAAERHHAIITSGGASRGDEDHMVKAVEKLGRVHFWQIAVKPGRPLAFGQIGDAVFIGLPGNPVAAMVCFLYFARPVLTALAGGDWPTPRSYLLPAAFALKKKPGRREYLRACLATGPDGRQQAHRIAREGSGILTSLVEAEGFVELAEEVTAVEAGEPVPFLPFSAFGLS
jgi:molybdopterin molybdotransferase